MKNIKNEILGIFISATFIPIIIPAYVAYHLLFKESDFLPEPETKPIKKIQTTNPYSFKWVYIMINRKWYCHLQ